MVYQIKVVGELDESWNSWLGDVASSKERQEDGSIITILLVDIQDQSTLFGILDHIRDMNIFLISTSAVKVK